MFKIQLQGANGCRFDVNCVPKELRIESFSAETILWRSIQRNREPLLNKKKKKKKRKPDEC